MITGGHGTPEGHGGSVYLDWAASAPPDPAALAEAAEVSRTFFGNPSSPHAMGREAAERMDAARGRFARLVGAEPREIVFTSGGTESNTAVLLSLLERCRLGGAERRRTRIVTTAIEHASIHDQARSLEPYGISVTVVKPEQNGIVDPSAVAAAVDDDTVLVSIMLVNNETGAIQKVAETGRLIREASRRRRKVLFHSDCVQALGKIPLSVGELGVDAASFSGHKLGGPRGIGALYLRADAQHGFLPVGGGQEAGRRPGTENLAGICALTVAAERRIAALPQDFPAASSLMEKLISGLKGIRGFRLFPESRTGRDAGSFSPWILCGGFPPLPGEVVVRTIDGRGYCIATGSACSTKKRDRTRVPESMGLSPETALSAIRISLGPETSEDDVDGLLIALREEVPPLLSISRGRSS
ncbi:MAG TPA: cysteine desulfurase family protein [Spirochaetia bacterium]|nr:cysteine desulfurase family protein [Spirochaetia bacterium]